MTRDEFENKIELILDSDTGADCTVVIDELIAHDDEQRELIEQQAKEIKDLKECREIANWFQTLVTRECIGTKQIPSLKVYIEQTEAQNKTLREILQNLVTGKCGELLLERAPYSYKRAQQALKEVS